MSPTYRRDPLAVAPEEDHPTSTTPTASRMAVSPASASSMRRNEESWVEVASQPSSSSVSSFTDEIVITGLRVGNASNGGAMQAPPQRRRRLLQQVEAAAGVVTGSGSRSATNAGTSSRTNSQTHQAVQTPQAPRLARHVSVPTVPSAPRSMAGSSQDEYDETESEGEHSMSSSAEHVHVRRPPTPPQTLSLLRQQDQVRRQRRAAASDGDDEEDDDDEGTALGAPGPSVRSATPATSQPSAPSASSQSASTAPTFVPQPNAFSHPPLSQQQRQPHHSVPSPHEHLASPYARSSMSSQRPQQHHRVSRTSSQNFMGHRDDNDAALRASLTTLLSCAAAARGIPKKETTTYGVAESSNAGTGVRPSSQPMDLRLAPESELMTEAPSGAPPRLQPQPPAIPPTRGASRANTRTHPTTTSSSTKQAHVSSRGSNISAASTSSKSKRAARDAAAGSGSKANRATKKKRTSTTATDGETTATFIPPTLLTWVVSAGVVVLVSVVGFGAGFVLGREVGRQEAASATMTGSGLGSSTANATTACGREIMRSSTTGGTLRRFRWGTGMSVVA